MNLLIIGGAGHVGKIIRVTLEAEHDCRYLDLRPVQGAEDRTIVGDLNDDDLLLQALQDREGLLYLAMGTENGARRTCNYISPAFDVNVRGWYRTLHHALQLGVRRFVYASSMSVYRDYIKVGEDESRPADSWAPYGLSKRLGEFIAEAAVQQCPDTCMVMLRLILPCNEADWPQFAYDPAKEQNTLGLGPQDTRRLFAAAVNHHTPGCHVFQTSGDMSDAIVPNHKVRAALGWSPQNH